MKWKGRRKSSNVDDRRGQSAGGFGGRGISSMLIGPLIKLLFSKVGLILIGGFLLISWLTGTNPLNLLQNFIGGNGMVNEVATEVYQGTPEEEELAEFSKVVLADTEDVWNQLMENYREPTMVLFTGQVKSACGFASSASGPFYCSADEQLYLDLSFYRDMKDQLNAPGDFAQAYVIAHEVGHHVQHLLGITEEVHGLRSQLNDAEYNKMSVKLELQADFLAGIWAHHTQKMKNILDEGDIEEALNAANAIGDDRLQKQAQGRVVPDSFTHGTSAQRMRWFKRGFDTGDLSQGDTFNAEKL
ncbi:neutral zinc metallopeptidase [Echinicola sp. CAU 1574]|uniref:Neutral zinc metallopeptidase n=1 Tax=Echinicola arenosa TaxID=2774144 RepID=A0ABR9AM92_9BACT|nr:neutral zinc metallopeptidase [Echinicola arenosa]MBD8489020.1 neutral zinc metallopeptidase [Echinicola arenosa]